MLQIHDWSVLVSKPMGVLSDCMFLFPPEDRISGMRAGRRTRRESDGDSPFSLLPARRRLGLRFGEENSHKFDRLVAFRLLANLLASALLLGHTWPVGLFVLGLYPLLTV